MMNNRIYISNYNLFTGAIGGYMALSDDNDYVPVSSLTSGYRLVYKDRKIFIYGLTVPHQGTGARKVHLLCDLLHTRRDGLWSTKDFFKKEYLMGNGVVLWRRKEDYKPIPLLLMCVKKDYLFNINRKDPDPSQFVLLIDRHFINNEEHFKLYRNVKRIYVDEIEEWLDVVYTNNIVDRCFKISLPRPKYGTIAEMLNGFKQVNELVTKCIKKEVNIGLDI